MWHIHIYFHPVVPSGHEGGDLKLGTRASAFASRKSVGGACSVVTQSQLLLTRRRRKPYLSMDEMKSDKERYIRVAEIDIVSSAGIRNIYFAERM